MTNNNNNKKKLFLIMAASDLEWSSYSSTPPLGLIALGSYLINQGTLQENNIYVCDFSIKEGKNFFLQRKEEIKEKEDEQVFFAFSVNFFNIKNSLELSKEIAREFLNKAYIIWGGPYVTMYLEKFAKYDDISVGVDFFIPYYGEEQLKKIITNPNNSCKILKGSESPFCDYKYNYGLINYLNEYQKGNESIPYFNNSEYLQLSYISAFGCPHRKANYENKKYCGFCSLFEKDTHPRKNVVDEVIEALDILLKNNTKKNILLRDVSDNPCPKVARELKEKMKDKGVETKILVYQRADKVTEESIENYDIIFLGTESGSDKILKKCNKGFNIDTVKKAYEIIRNENKKIITSFILGLKGENYKTIKETKDFINENIDDNCFLAAGANIFLPLPGSPFFDDLIKKVGTKNLRINNIRDLKKLQREWINAFTDINLYEMVLLKNEIEHSIRQSLESKHYFDFGIFKKYKYEDQNIPKKFLHVFKQYCNHIISLSEDENIDDFFWGTISIRESIFKKIYDITSDFLNIAFFIGENNFNFSKCYEKFKEINQFCFSAKDSILNEEIIKNNKPTISDVLPVLCKSLIVFKRVPQEYEDIKNHFDYIEVLPDFTDENIGKFDDKEKIKNFIDARTKKTNYKIIKKIVDDYFNFSGDSSIYKRKDIKDSFNMIFAMYELHLIALDYDMFIYYPLQTTSSGFVAFTLGLKFKHFKNPSHFKSFLIKFFELLNSSILRRLFVDLQNEFLSHALRSAVAAIMARNMSHNIGSHILARLDINKYKEKLSSLKPEIREQTYALIFADFNKYLQQKSDFLAEVSTEPDRPYISAYLFRDIILPFDQQVIVKEFIGSNEGIHSFDQIKINLSIKKTQIKVASWKCGGEGKDHNPCQKGFYKICLIDDCTERVYPFKIEGIENDILIEIPGTLGKFAIYNILEGFIRNSCKHNTDKISERLKNKQNPVLTVNLNVDEDSDGQHYVCEIWDDISVAKNNGKDLVKIMNEKIKSKLIDETGKLNRESWGTAELKICAALLKGLSFEEMEKDCQKCIEAIEKEGYLGYKFYLRKYLRGISIGKKWSDWQKKDVNFVGNE